MGKLWRYVKYGLGYVATGIGVVGATTISTAVGLPVWAVETTAGLIGVVTTGSAAIKEIKNSAWAPIFQWLGKQLSAWGRKKYGAEKWEGMEDHLDAGSILSWLKMANDNFKIGYDSDDKSVSHVGD